MDAKIGVFATHGQGISRICAVFNLAIFQILIAESRGLARVRTGYARSGTFSGGIDQDI